MLRTITVPAALVVSAALLLTGCGDDGDDDTGGGGAETTITTFPGEVESLPDPTAVPGGPQSAEEAAQELYDAWQAGDAGRANRVSEGETVDRLFRRAPADFEWTLEGCEETATERIWTCTWAGDGEPTMTVAFTRGYGWRVVDLATNG